jgi:hypothetical protein
LIISVEKVEENKKVDPFELPDGGKGVYYDISKVADGAPFAPEIPKSQVKEYGNNDRQQMKKYSELVDHPEHYNHGKIEVIDAIMDWELDFIEGNVVKYVARSRHKSSRVGDLKKARWYLDYLINKLEKE